MEPSLVDVVSALTPPGAAIAVEPVARPEGAEADHAAGRRAASRALETLGVRGSATGSRGARPDWPVGIVGSISHAAGWAIAVTAHEAEWIALGVDIDRACSLPAADAVAVCNEAERRFLAGLDGGDLRDRWATLLWATKEAAFKAYDSWTGGSLGGIDPACLDVRCGTDGSVTACLTRGIGSLARLTGRWAEAEGIVAVIVAAAPR